MDAGCRVKEAKRNLIPKAFGTETQNSRARV